MLLALGNNSCKKESDDDKKQDVWDIDAQGIPKFAGLYIDLSKVKGVSNFRSGEGHDYSDFSETCRSMKHYFKPFDTLDWSAIKVFSPVSGRLTRVEPEWAGVKLEIESDAYPAFRFVIFHVNPSRQFSVGETVRAGELIGLHTGSATMSDIAVLVNDPTRQGRLVSYFDAMADSTFAHFQARGAVNRSDFIISKSLRDSNPLTCNGDQFSGTDLLEKWYYFK